MIGGENIDFEDARMAFFTHDTGKANFRYQNGFSSVSYSANLFLVAQ